THVILEYGKPIYPKELDKDEKKRIGEYCSNIISETIHKNQALV
ncbi:MAG: 1-acyl-sn-glycerol-3-phosphate acyltransferase, partial [Dorea longicatena]|nr:1-acyl-sn-glycerol-3-phosphate acyltransferase [Dorea longicatena]